MESDLSLRKCLHMHAELLRYGELISCHLQEVMRQIVQGSERHEQTN